MTVGWYVHHHGRGHLQRFLAVRRHLPGVIGLSSLPRPAGVPAGDWVRLPLDAPTPDGCDPHARGALHWVPLGHDGLRERMAMIAGFVARARPSALVCDVSVEVALLARLMGVPVVWIAQRGRRTDDAHRLAYRVSTVLAPWTAAVESEDSSLPDGAIHVGALSRYDDRAPVAPPGRGRVLVMLGGGGHSVVADQLREAARAAPEWSWTTLGLERPVGAPVRSGGSPEDAWPALCAADVVVGAAGANVIAEVAAARRPLICLPQARPFDEQHAGAAALQRAGLAESLERWPEPRRWPQLLRRARDRDPRRWSILHDGAAAARLAGEVRRVAGEPPAR